MFDGRPLVAAQSIMPFPQWQEINISGQYIRGFGKIVSRRLSGVEGLTNEGFFCQLRNSVKAGPDWHQAFSKTMAVAPAISGFEGDAGKGSSRRLPMAFAVRRLFFDGLYSGKVDLGVIVPDELILHYDVHSWESWDRPGEVAGHWTEATYGQATFQGVEQAAKHVLARTLSFGGSKGSIGKLGSAFAADYAKATSRPAQNSPLVKMGVPAVYVEVTSDDDSPWPEIKGWRRATLSFAQIYWKTISTAGRDIPMFVARIDQRQLRNRGRHLRVSTLRYISELTNAAVFISSLNEYYSTDNSDPRFREVMHAHLKRTLKFLQAQDRLEHINWARDVVRQTVVGENTQLAIDRLAQIDDYWDAAKQRQMMEFVLGDKISADNGGIAIGRNTTNSGSISTSTTTEQLIDMRELAVDLRKIHLELSQNANDPVAKADALLIEQAATAAENNDEKTAVSLIKKVGGGVVDIAKSVASGLGVAYLKTVFGMP